jgi:hypothetical protein
MPLRYQWKDLDPTSDGNSPNENTRLLIEKAMANELPVKKMRAREKQFVGKTAAENSRQKKMDRLMYVWRAKCSGLALAGNWQARCDWSRLWYCTADIRQGGFQGAGCGFHKGFYPQKIRAKSNTRRHSTVHMTGFSGADVDK